MASLVYSRRFILGKGAGPFTYQVPAGKVAVIKQLTAVNQGGTAVAGYIYTASVNLWIGTVMAVSTTTLTGLYLTLSAGETLTMGANNPGLDLSAHGYELSAV